MSGIFRQIGGAEGCRRLAEAFYTLAGADRVLRPMFPRHPRCAIEAFTLFLTEFLDAPRDGSRRRFLSLEEAHQRFRIGAAERAAWLRTMRLAIEETGVPAPAAAALLSLFDHSSAYLVNQGEPIHAGAACLPVELEQPWRHQLIFDQAVAAIRQDEGDRAVQLAGSLPLQTATALLGEMAAHPHPATGAYLRRRLDGQPGLLCAAFAGGQTLLHVAAAVGDLSLVELLIRLGADPEALDEGRHTPLYSVANQCQKGGGAVVRALAAAGASIDAADGVKRCTPLHMAARRGNLEIAAALLECGAALEARDSEGNTPLRRAVNCGKPPMAAFLLARGADPNSRGSRGKTPRLAARTAAMKQALGC